jgi:hypothetical protein
MGFERLENCKHMKVRSKEAQSGTQNCSAYIVAAKYFDT